MNRRGATEVNQSNISSKQGRLRQFLISRHRYLLARGFTVSSLNLVRLGAMGAILAGVAWIASSLLEAAIASGRSPEVLGFASLDEALYVVAVAGTMGGIVGLHVRQVPSYGRLGMVGFLATFTGTALLLIGLVLNHRDFDGCVLKSVELKCVNSVHRRVGSHSSYLLWASTSSLLHDGKRLRADATRPGAGARTLGRAPWVHGLGCCHPEAGGIATVVRRAAHHLPSPCDRLGRLRRGDGVGSVLASGSLRALITTRHVGFTT